MDSINKNQPEENLLNLSNEEAVKKIKDLTSQAKTCFFCTRGIVGVSNGVRPMTVQKVDDSGACWFLSSNDSQKDQEIEEDATVDLYFQGSAHSDFLHLTGMAELSQDKTKIKELWEPILKTWFTQGVDDPRISVIKFVPKGGYYWDNKHGNAVAGVKMAVGAVLGKTIDDSIEGHIHLSR
jgi:general stress protein 26